MSLVFRHQIATTGIAGNLTKHFFGCALMERARGVNLIFPDGIGSPLSSMLIARATTGLGWTSL
jgi:hypothetical protein